MNDPDYGPTAVEMILEKLRTDLERAAAMIGMQADTISVLAERIGRLEWLTGHN